MLGAAVDTAITVAVGWGDGVGVRVGIGVTTTTAAVVGVGCRDAVGAISDWNAVGHGTKVPFGSAGTDGAADCDWQPVDKKKTMNTRLILFMAPNLDTSPLQPSIESHCQWQARADKSRLVHSRQT